MIAANLQPALNLFLAKVNEVFQAQNAKMPNLTNYYEAPTVEEGSKFLRIVSKSGGSRSVYCFVNKLNGDILKAAGYKAPAKGARGSVFKPESYAHADPYGGWLYAR